MSFNVDFLATEDVGMVHVDTAAVGVVELAIAGEWSLRKPRQHDNKCTCKHMPCF